METHKLFKGIKEFNLQTRRTLEVYYDCIADKLQEGSLRYVLIEPCEWIMTDAPRTFLQHLKESKNDCHEIGKSFDEEGYIFIGKTQLEEWFGEEPFEEITGILN